MIDGRWNSGNGDTSRRGVLATAPMAGSGEAWQSSVGINPAGRDGDIRFRHPNPIAFFPRLGQVVGNWRPGIIDGSTSTARHYVHLIQSAPEGHARGVGVAEKIFPLPKPIDDATDEHSQPTLVVRHQWFVILSHKSIGKRVGMQRAGVNQVFGLDLDAIARAGDGTAGFLDRTPDIIRKHGCGNSHIENLVG